MSVRKQRPSTKRMPITPKTIATNFVYSSAAFVPRVFAIDKRIRMKITAGIYMFLSTPIVYEGGTKVKWLER